MGVPIIIDNNNLLWDPNILLLIIYILYILPPRGTKPVNNRFGARGGIINYLLYYLYY